MTYLDLLEIFAATMFRKGSHLDEISTRFLPDRPMRNVLITGGLGFIGSNYINHLLATNELINVYNIDKVSYCSNENNVERQHSQRYSLTKCDITNKDCVMDVLTKGDIDTVIHFAAETHVSNSFVDSLPFTLSNVYGTHVLLECARQYGKIGKFVFISTDEVYGEVSTPQMESDAINTTSPYAATKAAAELLVKSYHISYNLPVVITRSSNLYGPYQYPEKIVPRFIMLAHSGKKLTIEGSGNQMRSFLYISDFSRALDTVLDRGVIGEVYNIGRRDSFSVREVAKRVLSHFVELGTDNASRYLDHVNFVQDRLYNDVNYELDTRKLEKLGWQPCVDFDVGLSVAISWYKKAFDDNYWPHINM